MSGQKLFVILMLMTLLSACAAVQPVSNAPSASEPVAAGQDTEVRDHGMGAADELGTVEVPISCTREAQAEFNHGMALLHSFWFGPAIKSFNTVAELDPDCAMAHWGIAMALLGNPFTWPLSGQPLVDGWAAVEMARDVGAETPREAAYIDAIAQFYQDADTVDHRTRAVAYTEAMEQLAQAYPDDTEAAIFYALALTITALPTDKSYANQLEATRILEEVLVAQPDHPGVTHYIIHSNDYPSLAASALNAALGYAKIAPAAPHAQHMPSHIFTRMGYWQESVDTNLVSAAVVKEELGAAYAEGIASSSLLHPMDYLMYAYLQMSQDNLAEALLNEINAIEKMKVENSVGAFAFASMPARYALERGQWTDAAVLRLHPQELAWDRFPHAEAVVVFARGLGAARSGDIEAARQELERLPILREAMLATNQTYWAGQAEIQMKEIEAWIALAEGQNEQALALMSEAAALEDATEKVAVTPGPLVPAHELLGEMLLELDRPAEALAEFETSHVIEPNRFRGLYGAARAAELAGETETARGYYEALLTLSGEASSERAEVTEAEEFLAQ